ncbi:MAG: hypothetical protein AB1806_16970 [Acidobacteriota bacterium]
MHRKLDLLPLVVCACLLIGLTGAQAAPRQSAASSETQAARPTPPAKADAQTPSSQKPAPPAQQAAPASREQTPEQKAYAAAIKITDPDEKLAALRKLIEDFPGTSVVNAAENQILMALVRKVTDGIKQVQEQAGKIAEKPPVSGRSSAGSVASALSNAGILLEEAEKYARRAVEELSDERAFVEAQKTAFVERQAEAAKRNPQAKPLQGPGAALYTSMFTSSRQSALVTLGQVLDRRGKTGEAEKALKEAFLMDPSARPAATAAVQLAKYAKQAGFDYEQLEYLTVAALAGQLNREGRADLAEVYRKTHRGSLDGLDEMLNERYERTATKVDVSPYGLGAPRAGRTVVAELFTGSGCPPCVAADLAFEGAMERYAPRDLAVLVYHLHIPRPDPMTNPSSLDRAKYYAVNGTPTFFIDGDTRHVGGGAALGAQKLFADRVESVVDRRLVAKPSANVELEVNGSGTAIEVVARASKIKTNGRAVTLHLALVEELVTYSGENGVRFHPMVVRQLARSSDEVIGFPAKAGSLKVAHTFDIDKAVAEAKAHLDDFEVNNTRFGKFEFAEKKHGIDASRLSVVAFVQEDDSKKILQAVTVKVPASGTARDPGL